MFSFALRSQEAKQLCANAIAGSAPMLRSRMPWRSSSRPVTLTKTTTATSRRMPSASPLKTSQVRLFASLHQVIDYAPSRDQSEGVARDQRESGALHRLRAFDRLPESEEGTAMPLAPRELCLTLALVRHPHQPQRAAVRCVATRWLFAARCPAVAVHPGSGRKQEDQGQVISLVPSFP